MFESGSENSVQPGYFTGCVGCRPSRMIISRAAKRDVIADPKSNGSEEDMNNAPRRKKRGAW